MRRPGPRSRALASLAWLALATTSPAASLAWLALATTSPAAALAAGATKHASQTTSVTSAAPTASVPARPPSSGSGGGSLGGGLTAPGGVPTAASTTPTVISTATASPTGGGGLSGSSAIGIAMGAFIVLGGISYYIWRDARRRAPVAPRWATGDPDSARQGRPGSKTPPKARKLSSAERKRRKRGRAKR